LFPTVETSALHPFSCTVFDISAVECLIFSVAV
jgi:hypothetical protein